MLTPLLVVVGAACASVVTARFNVDCIIMGWILSGTRRAGNVAAAAPPPVRRLERRPLRRDDGRDQPFHDHDELAGAEHISADESGGVGSLKNDVID
jgi:hypothetical protein